MNWRDLSIKKKFIYFFFIIVVFISAIALLGAITVKRTEESFSRWNQLETYIYELNIQEIAHLDWRYGLRDAIDEKSLKKLSIIEMDYTKCNFGKWFHFKGKDILMKELPELKTTLEDIDRLHRNIHATASFIKESIESKDKNKIIEADKAYKIRLVSDLTKLREHLNQTRQKLREKLIQLEQDAKKEVLYNKYFISILIVIFIGSIAMLFIKFTNTITSNLNKAVEAAESLSQGDLTVDLRTHYNDETGKLLKAMQKMSQSMLNIAKSAEAIADGNLRIEINPHSEKDILGKSLNIMVTRLRNQTQDILEAVNVLASSVSQIMTTASEIAATASETATSVSETTVTAEEVRQTAKLVSSRANNVSEVTKKVIEASQSSYASVDETIEQMNSIRVKMDSIAESIVRLSEQGQAIGEIVNTVNDLAERSNLLAVNASIEAARAGEHGRGFAVVAQEVRSLAEQSKAATKQIKSILNDIQSATSKAVLVTEQGNKAVQEGIRQSSDAGQNIRNLALKISDVVDAGSQIVASSQQQVAGMDQIVFAMENINQASAQNAENIKMVETVTRNLNEIAQKLKALTDVYKT
ncbi:MAG: methyl-accepting chemotaxis protein [Thermodesulfovibrionales bacterium]|nr:methyl-accepting chemotaxis protein [Thermodesulfovibrionales bacterium]